MLSHVIRFRTPQREPKMNSNMKRTYQHPNVSRMIPYFERAALAASLLDRRYRDEADVVASGLGDCLDAPFMLPTGGYALLIVIGSPARCYRS
jgi:hypothetical protein